jgi:2-hydroxychromene-2-carboxylate isomerase
MSLAVDLFWSFRSPYSYLATGRLVAVASQWDIDLRVRPVLPIAVRTPEFFDRVNPMWPLYLLRDTMRIAQSLEIPFQWPQPDPIVQDFATRTIAADQPYIHRLTRLGIEATRRGRGLAFIDEVSKVIWGGTPQWNEGDHLALAAQRAQLDLAAMDQAIAQPASHDEEIERNQQALTDAGHWGVPTMVFDGEPFFGQDRIDLLLWRLRQHGLAPRPR